MGKPVKKTFDDLNQRNKATINIYEELAFAF